MDSISYLGVLKAGRRSESALDFGNRSTFHYWGKNPSPAVGPCSPAPLLSRPALCDSRS